MEEWMWRKIIEKMYDPKDYEVLMLKFSQIIQERKSLNRSRVGGAQKYLIDNTIQQQIMAGNRKMTREEINSLM
jgi:hypothetical protein